jgi:hypothetical protein
MTTLSQRMLPIRLGVLKRALYVLATGKYSMAPAVAEVGAVVAADHTSTAASAITTAAPMKFTDTAVEDVIADIEAQAAAPTRLPKLPSPPAERPSPNRRSPSTLQDRRQQQGLRPGQWDPTALNPLQDKRTQELMERKSYLHNFWYAAGEGCGLQPAAAVPRSAAASPCSCGCWKQSAFISCQGRRCQRPWRCRACFSGRALQLTPAAGHPAASCRCQPAAQS